MKIFIIIISILIYKVAPQTPLTPSCRYFISMGEYVCSLTINNPNNFNNFTHIAGTHLAGRTNINVTRIEHADNAVMSNIPSIICSQFPNLKLFIFGGSGISNFDENAFRSCQFMENIWIDSNRLTDIIEDSFVENFELQVLGFFGNNITELPENLFRNNKKLRVLNIGTNPFTTFPPKLFAGLSKLEIIGARNGRLTKIFEENFANLSSLHVLDLTDNQIDFIPKNAFADLGSLEYLIMDSNNLTSFSPSWLEGTNLLYLSFANNFISELPEDIFSNSSKLSELYMHNNPFQKFPGKIFHPLYNLTALTIGHCGLTSVDPSLFETLTELTRISLAGNFLEELPIGMLKNSPKLEFIDLSNNKLNVVSSSSFGTHRQLLSVWLGFNRIDAIDEKLFDNIRTFEIDMTDNICANEFIADWSGTQELIRKALRVCFDNYEGKDLKLFSSQRG